MQMLVIQDVSQLNTNSYEEGLVFLKPIFYERVRQNSVKKKKKD